MKLTSQIILQRFSYLQKIKYNKLHIYKTKTTTKHNLIKKNKINFTYLKLKIAVY